jgi:hypothetical protein
MSGRGIDHPELHFNPGDPKLGDLGRGLWFEGETRLVEFFPGRSAIVHLLTTADPELPDVLAAMTSPIVADFEWHGMRPISLYQFCSSERVAVIRDVLRKPSVHIRTFLESQKFTGKGSGQDRNQLRLRYGPSFHIDIDDIEYTRLKPHGLSCGFMDMVTSFVGPPKASFKSKRISTSNWEARVLTIEQVVYAAFDVFAIFCALPALPPPRSLPFRPPVVKLPSLFRRDVAFVCVESPLPDPPFDFPALVQRRASRGKFCTSCGRDFDDIRGHAWSSHSQLLAEIMGWDLHVIDAAVSALEVTDAGKLCIPGSPKFQAFYRLVGWMKPQSVPRDTEPEFMQLFFDFLKKTGRVSVLENMCLVCDKDAGDDLRAHMWNCHSSLLAEWAADWPIHLDVVSGSPEQARAAVRFLSQMRLYTMKNEMIACVKCNLMFIDPVSLLYHVVGSHLQLVVTRRALVNDFERERVADVMVCSDIFPEGWTNGADELFERVTTVDGKMKERNKFTCEECRVVFEEMSGFELHCMMMHVNVLPRNG